MNYNPVLRAPSTDTQNPTPKCTILASHISDYSFNFGNDISYKGNSIYARFRSAVNLSDDPLNQSGDVMFISESNLHDTSEPPIEVYDDDFGSEVEFDNISSTENFSSDGVHDSSFTTNGTLDTSLPIDHKSPEAKPIDGETMNVFNENSAEIRELDNKMQTLNDLKKKMLSQTSNSASNQNEEENRDTNTKQLPRQNDGNISSTTALADFIPLTSNLNKYEPVRSPSPVSADSTTPIDEHTDATIHLMPQHCKHLVTEKGRQFLQQRSEHFNVTARLEWRNYGNVLIVSGMPAAQRDFHNELKEFFRANEPVKPNYCTLLNSLPKNRSALIKFIRGQLLLLDSGACNNRIGDPMGLYHRIGFNQLNPSKNNLKQTSKLRKHMNMVLFGRYGFDKGQKHLNALQNQLRNLIEMDSTVNVHQSLRKRIAENIDYIFSDIDHGNYEEIIKQYNNMRKNRSLPPLNLDRKLLGLKMNVIDYGDNNATSPRERNHQRNMHNSENSFDYGNVNINGNSINNRMNALPSSNDIQLINVSQPSTSQYNPGPSTQSMQRSSALDRWNY